MAADHDMSTYWGRVRACLDVVDPRTLAPEACLGLSQERAQRLVNGEEAASGPAELRLARKITKSAFHPDTGEEIFMPFRMSGFVPFGTPIVVGMLLANSPAQTVFWQWANQSHNAAINYANRNKTAHVSAQDTALSYVAAVSVAVGVSLGMDKLVRQVSKPVLRRFVPFVAVATANVFNITMMRRRELESGIAVFDEAGKEIGKSVVAAQRALTETALSRAVLPVPILVVSPMLMIAAERAFPVLRRRPALRVPVQALAVSSCFLAGLPLSLALFSDRSAIAVRDLEPRLQAATTVPTAFFNKGL